MPSLGILWRRTRCFGGRLCRGTAQPGVDQNPPQGPSSQYRCYDFVREYLQRDDPHCPELPVIHDKPLTAVLDGQKRLTAFNIGLRRLETGI